MYNFICSGLSKAKKLAVALTVGTVAAFASGEAKAANIVSVNETTGAVTWDVSTLVTGLVAALALAIGSVVGIMLIRKGWTILRSYFMRS